MVVLLTTGHRQQVTELPTLNEKEPIKLCPGMRSFGRTVCTSSLILVLILLMTISNCAYFNTFYNAQKYFDEAVKELSSSKTEKIASSTKRKFDSAIEKANRVILEYPDSRWSDDASYIVALSYYYNDELVIAKKKMEEFIIQYPWSDLYPEIEIWYGRVLWKLGEPEQALYQLQNTVVTMQDQSFLSEAYLVIADIYQEQSILDSSLLYYDRIIKLGKDYSVCAEAQFRIAEIYLQKNQIQEAIKNLKGVSRFSPPPVLREKTQVLFAKIYRESEQYDEARELIIEKLADPENESIWPALELQLGLIYLAEEDYESAKSRFTQITETYKRTKESAEAYYRLAMLNMTRFHDYEKAQKQFEAVSKEYKKSEFTLESNQKALETKRFFVVEKELDDISLKIIDVKGVVSPGELDSTYNGIDENEGPEELKKAIEARIEKSGSIVDTAALYKNYYENIYELAEIYYFNFQEMDSAVTKFEFIVNSPVYNSLVDKSLYALYYVYRNENDSLTAFFYRDKIKDQFPESPYLAFIEKKEVGVPQEYREAENRYVEAERFFESGPDSAIFFLTEINRDYPLTLSGEKSSFSIAWLYHHKLFELEKAVSAYRSFIDSYPESQFFPEAEASFNALSSLLYSPEVDSTSQDSEIEPLEKPELETEE